MSPDRRGPKTLVCDPPPQLNFNPGQYNAMHPYVDFYPYPKKIGVESPLSYVYVIQRK